MADLNENEESEDSMRYEEKAKSGAYASAQNGMRFCFGMQYREESAL